MKKILQRLDIYLRSASSWRKRNGKILNFYSRADLKHQKSKFPIVANRHHLTQRHFCKGPTACLRERLSYHSTMRNVSRKLFRAVQLLFVCHRGRLFTRAGGSACSPLLASFILAAAKRKKTHPRPALRTKFPRIHSSLLFSIFYCLASGETPFNLRHRPVGKSKKSKFVTLP